MTRKQWANLVICLVFFGAIVFGARLAVEADGLVDLFNPEPVVSARAEAFHDSVRLEKAEFELNQVTKEVSASFELVNHSPVAVRDIEISCDFNTPDQDFMGRGRWIVYQTLEPGSSDRYRIRDRRYISHRVRPETISCAIVELEPAGVRMAGHQSSGH